MEILFVLWVKLSPDHLFEAVGLGVNELGVLRDRQVGITDGEQRQNLSFGGFNESQNQTEQSNKFSDYTNITFFNESQRASDSVY